MTYSVPYTFVAGTKASADEVNENFSYISTVLSGMNAARYPFCVNSGNRNDREEADLLSFSGSKVSTKIGGNFPELHYTTGFGVPKVAESSSELVLSSAAYNSIVPTMTSTISGTVTCATNSEASGYECWRAFDKNENTYWGSFTGVTTAELAIAFSSRHVVRAYFVKTLTASEWRLEGSNDESAWTVLDEYAVAEPSTILRKLETIGNYNVYKLTVTSSGSEYQVRIAELELYERSEAGSLRIPETQILYLGQTENGVELEASSGKFFRQEKEPAGKALYDAIIPTMTSNLVPEGYVINASSFSSQHSPYLATDRKKDTYWEATNIVEDAWIQVQTPNPMAAKACKIALHSGADSLDKAPITGVISGSHNGATWIPLCSFRDLIWNYAGEEKYLYFTDNNTKYSYYRITADAPFASLGEFQLFTEASNGEYLLGEANLNDVWFKAAEPYEAYKYTSLNTWTEYQMVPVGEADLNENGEITEVRTYPYDQNGFNINAFTTKANSGNIVTKDSYTTHFGESGYTILPNKCIFQWGKAMSGDFIIFPAAFPHRVFAIVPTPINNSVASSSVRNPDTSGFTLLSQEDGVLADNVQNYWFAIGW